MSVTVLGISGSPVKKSNTDRLVQAILNSTGVETEFVKLSTLNVRSCFACDFEYSKVEDQKQVWEEAIYLGRLIGERLQ